MGDIHFFETINLFFYQSHGLSQEQLVQVIFSKTKEEHGGFWSEISVYWPSDQHAFLTAITVAATSVPARPIIAVYHYVHRAYNPLGFQGKWTKEEDSALIG